MKKIIMLLLLSVFIVPVTIADVCDYRPSKLVGSTVTGTIAGGAGVAAATGVGMKAAGIYAVTNATTGAAMLGSTAAGASAAGTTGIIAGTSGILGSIGAALLSPLVIIPAAVTVVGIGVYEGSCYLSE